MVTQKKPRGAGEDRIRALEGTLEALREDSEVAHVLLGLAGTLAEVRTVEETLEAAVGIVPELLGAPRGLAAAWEAGRRGFAVRGSAGFDDPAELRALASGLLAEAGAGRGPVFVSDDRSPSASPPASPAGAWALLPLTRWGEELGVLRVEYPEPRGFGPKDEALARGVARQLGVALANARRFSLLQDLRAFQLRVGSRLGLQSVVAEVAAGACDLLSGDGAALYFLDPSNRSLVLAGSTGVGAGLVERLARIDLAEEAWSGLLASTVLFVPDLPKLSGVAEAPRGAIGVPVAGRDRGAAGAILVFFDRHPRLGPDEAEALSVFAAHSGIAVEVAQRFERQRRVARSLQQGLLSVEVPPMGVWEVGAVYEPAGGEAEIGGDFFDVFDVGAGRVALSVGDVSGKGAEAAAGAAMAKYMLRAFAIRNPAPASVLFHLNNALVQSFDDDRFTTLVYALFDPSTGLCHLAVGGHPAPLVYRSATGAVELVQPQGSIVGAFEEQRFDEASLELGPQDVLVAYTDGLAEARRGSAFYGRDGIAASLARHGAVRGARDLARLLFEDARAFGSILDDTVVLVLASSEASA